MKIFLGFFLMVSCTVAANLLLKSGAMVPPSQRIIFGWFSWKTFAGFAVFGSAALIYAWLLQWMPLNVVQSFAAVQFIAVILASAFFLSESIPLARWIGILLIAFGIVLVGFSNNLALTPASDRPVSRL